jgi:hypothetical protein
VAEPGEKLGRVLALWGEMSGVGSVDALASALAQDVVWQGLLPELTCNGRDQVLELLGRARGGRLPKVTRVDAEEVGDRVVVTITSPEIGPGPEGTALEQGGPRTLVLSFDGASIVRMHSFATRQEALASAR